MTTALVQFEIDRPLTELSHMIGAGAAQQAWPRSRLALLNLREASGPYLYARLRRMDCGGEDEDFTDEQRRNALTSKRQNVGEEARTDLPAPGRLFADCF
ncbi:hypothetical protein [Mesorhizobium huakuii]|uniref:Uncharacterized protein n=1 Tax=Mesorhizobium huakuii TaxID=28104 RepID=A0ABZ0W034_9HYPH|nr:hypothetical protein [Mesorhizobium huakuii]WQC02744.1 hypothetical protein U0R22_006999 [Mesorhizobium huakuii]